MILGKFFKDRRLWLITIAVFILVITVFDKNNLIEAWRLNYLMKREDETIYLLK